jgi:hypothetical protein
MSNNCMKDKKNAVITGLFFIGATVSAIIGVLLYDPILVQHDYIQNGAKFTVQLIWGAVFELILVCTASGTAIMLTPYLRKFNEHLGLGYLCFRFLEAIIILIGIVAMLSIVTLINSFVNESSPDLASYQSAGIIAKAIHDWTFILGPLFMLGINTFIYSYVFLKTEMIPKQLALVGIVGAILVFSSSLLVMFGIIQMSSTIQISMAIPIAVYEMVLAGWLIAKGFNLSFQQRFSLTAPAHTIPKDKNILCEQQPEKNFTQ